jgi:hypothetical protein
MGLLQVFGHIGCYLWAVLVGNSVGIHDNLSGNREVL